MYLVIETFTDLEHGRKYELGEEYPAQGYETTPERINALLSGNNLAGIKLIKEVKASKPKEVEAPIEETPKEEKPKSKPKKAKKGGTKKASK